MPLCCLSTTHVKYCAHFRIAPALIARSACKRLHAHTNVEKRHITRLTISSAEACRTVRYADACPQSFTLREEARSCLAALSQLSRSTLLPVIVERHLVSGYYALKFYSFHVTCTYVNAMQLIRYARSRRKKLGPCLCFTPRDDVILSGEA